MNKHVDGKWCQDLTCSRCYTSRIWQTAKITELELELYRLRRILRSIVADAPKVECNNFHHHESDRHHSAECPPLSRWNAAIDAAMKDKP